MLKQLKTENVCGQPQQCRWGDVGGCGPKTKVKSVSGRQQVVDMSRFLGMQKDLISILQVEIRGRDGFGQEAKHWLRVSLPSPGASMGI